MCDRPRRQAETRLYLVRHAEPQGPKDVRRFLGSTDPPLSEIGHQQAHDLARKLEQVDLRAIHSSDLARAVETAEAVAAGSGLSVIREPALREIDAGIWDGLSFAEAKKRYPEDFARREQDVFGFVFPGGESFRGLETRVVPAIERIFHSGGEDVLVVAHQGVNRVVLAHYLGMPLEEIFSLHQEYCAVSLLDASLGPDGSLAVTVELSPGI